MKKMLSAVWSWVERWVKTILWLAVRKIAKFGSPAAVVVLLFGYFAETGTFPYMVLPGEHVVVRGYRHEALHFLGWSWNADYMVISTKTGWEKSVRVKSGDVLFDRYDQLSRRINFSFDKVGAPVKIMAGADLLPAPPGIQLSPKEAEIRAGFVPLPTDTTTATLHAWAIRTLNDAAQRGEKFDDTARRVAASFRSSMKEVPYEQPQVQDANPGSRLIPTGAH